ncbi:MAG: hypothetical protein ACHQ1H_07280 [Nitrososphaerales archaeon]
MSRAIEDHSVENLSWVSRFRRKPEQLIIPFLSFWLIVNVPPWPMYGGSILVLVARWGTVGVLSGSTNSIFPITYALAIFIFFFFYFRFRKNVGLDRKRSLLLSATIPFGFVAFFETVYQELFSAVRPQLFHTPPSGQLLLASWILLSLSTVPYWKLTRKFYPVIAVDIGGFLIWLALGYPQIYETGPPTVYALILNIVTKCSFALTYIVLIFDGTTKQPNAGDR